MKKIDIKAAALYWVLTLLVVLACGLATYYGNLGFWGWTATITLSVAGVAGFAGWIEVLENEDESYVLKGWAWFLKDAWLPIVANKWRVGFGLAGAVLVLTMIIVAFRTYPQQAWWSVGGVLIMVLGIGGLRYCWYAARRPKPWWCIGMLIMACIAIGGPWLAYERGWKTDGKAIETATVPTPAVPNPISEWKERVSELEDIVGGDFKLSPSTVRMPWNAVPAGRRAGVESKAKDALKKYETDFGGELEGATITKVVSAEFFFEAGGVRRARAWALIKGKSGLLYKGLPTSIEISLGWDAAATAAFAAEALDSMKPLPTR